MRCSLVCVLCLLNNWARCVRGGGVAGLTGVRLRDADAGGDMANMVFFKATMLNLQCSTISVSPSASKSFCNFMKSRNFDSVDVSPADSRAFDFSLNSFTCNACSSSCCVFLWACSTLAEEPGGGSTSVSAGKPLPFGIALVKRFRSSSIC